MPKVAKSCQKLSKVTKSYQKLPKICQMLPKVGCYKKQGTKTQSGYGQTNGRRDRWASWAAVAAKNGLPPQKKEEKNLKCSVRPPPFGCLFHLLFRMKSHPNNDPQQKYIEKLNQLFQEMLSIPVISVITCHVSQVTCHVHQSNESLQTRNCFQPLLTSQPVTRKLLHTQIVRHVGMR